MKITQEGLDLVKRFEGFRAEAYKDAVGIWTIGYGTTAAAGVGIAPRPGMSITKAEAEWYLQKALEKFAAQILPKIKAPINPNEFSAFLSLAYNIGPGAFSRSTALREFNAGDKTKAAMGFMLWNKGTVNGKKVILRGLVTRRSAERDLFLKPAQANPAPIAKPDWMAALVKAILALFGKK